MLRILRASTVWCGVMLHAAYASYVHSTYLREYLSRGHMPSWEVYVVPRVGCIHLTTCGGDYTWDGVVVITCSL